jgi:outer membrane protein assembly factor BamB
MKNQNLLFILSNGKVAAINKKDGTIVWEIKLKSYCKTTTMYTIGQINVDGDKLYIGISGILLCLNATNGSLVWINELKGWGYTFVSIANTTNTDGQSTTAAQQQAASAAASAAALAATM